MDDLTSFVFNEEYRVVKKLGDKLAEIDALLDWEAFRPIVRGLYINGTEKGGRPNIDEVVMVKLLVLQQWNGLSNPEIQRQVVDRISFRKFLGFPETIPDFTTVWLFRERLSKTGKDRELWAELQRQMDNKGLKVKKGVIQDATFITADPGHAKADTPRGDDAETRRSKEGTWVKKASKSYFGFKLHVKTDMDHGLIREIETTTASVHDSQIDLSKPGEVNYRDRGYHGAPSRGYSATMKRGARDHPIGIRDVLRNKRISRKRSPGERPFAVIRTVFKSAHVRVTTVARTHVKMVATCLAFNLCQLLTLRKKCLT